jgi:hypothetical protein
MPSLHACTILCNINLPTMEELHNAVTITVMALLSAAQLVKVCVIYAYKIHFKYIVNKIKIRAKN